MNKCGIKILDGAVGSLLELIYPELLDSQVWMNQVLIDNSKAVQDIHEEYCKSGADIITTFTFRTNARCYSREERRIFVRTAVTAAFEARKTLSKKLLVYGSNGPAEDCYQKERTIGLDELENIHREHIGLLKEYGVDCILNETMSHLDEIIIVCNICEELRTPYVLSIYFDKNLTLLSNDSIQTALQVIFRQKGFKPLAIAFNCVHPQHLSSLIGTDIFKEYNDIQFGFSLNCGSTDYYSQSLEPAITPLQLSQFYQQNLLTHISPQNIHFLGSCCLSNPSHTKQLVSSFSFQN